MLSHVINLEAMEECYMLHRTRSGWVGVPLAAGHPYPDISGAVFGARLRIR